MESSFELFDHTADMGIRVRAAQPAGLIAPAVAGLYAAIGELLADSTQSNEFRFEATAGDPAVLVRDFLTEVLNLFERDHQLLISFDHIHWHSSSGVFQWKCQHKPTPHPTKYSLEVTARSAPVDPARSVYYREVKAITYHDLGIHEIEGGFEATLIVDI